MSTLTIGCKQPNGIILSAMVNGKLMEHRLNGWNQNVIQGTGTGITHDVPEDLWKAWREQFKDSKLVKGGFVFAHKQERSVKAEATEKKSKKTGREQLPQIKGDAKEGALGAVDK